ncbi:MAG: FKBP-type peptidyl-prolyl cis-trans isomerase [Candidatus Promineifilaceae bacterium]
MNYQRKHITWFIIAAFILVIAVVSCGPATPTPADEAVDTQAETDVAVESSLEEEGAAEAAETTGTEAETATTATAEPVILDGAVTTDSGLQILEVVAGDGPSPQDGDLVTMNFSGSLPDGTVFGDSYSSGEPITVIFGADQLLPGWEEGLSLMKEGGTAKMVLPPELAFGESGMGMIPANSEIILDVELLTVEPAPMPTEVDEADLETTDSGLQYYDLVEGDGPMPEEGGRVSTDFTIWVQGEDGPEFIVTSVGQGPISFVIGNLDVVFPGWDEAVSTMKQGGTRYVVIPPDLALGSQGGGSIPPDATLLMEITLVDVQEPVKMTEVDEADYTTTDSGLQYYDIVVGDGPTPEEGQIVVVDYTGWLEDGTKFDSSLDRGQPFTFPLGTGSVIAGWDEGVATMKVGGKRQLRIPADLAYGETGSGTIPPGATLIFDIELLDAQGG